MPRGSAMSYKITTRFQDDLLSPEFPDLKDHVLQTLRMLQEDPTYPGLQSRKTYFSKDTWYCRIDDNYRMVYQREGSTLVALRVVPHRVFDHLDRRQLGLGSVIDWEVADQTELAQEAQKPQFSEQLPARSTAQFNPLKRFTLHQLRLLGIPQNLTKSCKDAPTLNDALAVPGLPTVTQTILEALATDPSNPLTDPFTVFKRATLDQLEDLCKGKIQDLFLELAPEQTGYVERVGTGPTLLRGVAGSGKSTIGVYRAIKLAQQGHKVLLITYNPILKQVLKNLVVALVGSIPPTLDLMHFQEWCLSILHTANLSPVLRNQQQQSQDLQSAINTVARSNAAPILKRDLEFFAQEFRWVIKGFGISHQDEYLKAPRYGRKQALSRLARSTVWEVYQAYLRLIPPNQVDEGDIAREASRIIEAAPGLVAYDHVIIDEAQDLSPVELSLLHKTLDVTKGSVLLLGDAAQSIAARGFTWKQIGWDMRGRSFTLRINYRNTKEVVQVAHDLIQRNQHLIEQGELIPIESVRKTGPKPIVLVFGQEHEEIAFLIEQITIYRQENQMRLRDISILATHPKVAQQYATALNTKGIPNDLWLSEEGQIDILEESVKITTISLAKGLEFPVVFLVGMHQTYLPALRANLEDEEQVIESERQRMRLYVGLTRSAEMLFILSNRSQMALLVGELNHVELRNVQN